MSVRATPGATKQKPNIYRVPPRRRRRRRGSWQEARSRVLTRSELGRQRLAVQRDHLAVAVDEAGAASEALAAFHTRRADDDLVSAGVNADRAGSDFFLAHGDRLFLRQV